MKNIIILFFSFFSFTQIQAQEVLSIEKIGTQLEFILEIGVQLPLESSVDIYKVNYTTVDLNGDATEASGTLYIPYDLDEAVGTIVYGHGTVNDRYEVPSYGSQEQLLPAAMAAKGYVAVCADYLGLGDNDGLHPYVHADSEAWTNRDLLIAAQSYLAGDDSIIDMEMPDDLYITGYSQGGHTAMALHRYMETVDDHGFKVQMAVPMSGPYSIEYIYNSILDHSQAYDYPAYIAWVVLSYQEVYGNIYEDANDFFKPELAPTIMAYADGEIVLDSLNSALINYLVTNYGGTFASRIIKNDVFEELVSNPDNNLAIASRDNNVYDWSPSAMTRLLYCEADDQVPFQNSILAEETMNFNGAEDVLSININPNFDHGQCILPAVQSFITMLGEFTTSTSEYDIIEEIFPNPATDVINISGNNLKKIEIFNATGSLLKELYDFGSQIDVSSFVPGMYVIRTINDNDQYQVAKVIIK